MVKISFLGNTKRGTEYCMKKKAKTKKHKTTTTENNISDKVKKPQIKQQ